MSLDDLVKGGGVTIINICHDDWCKTLKTGNGADCNCNPTQEIKTLKSDSDFKAYFDGETK